MQINLKLNPSFSLLKGEVILKSWEISSNIMYLSKKYKIEEFYADDKNIDIFSKREDIDLLTAKYTLPEAHEYKFIFDGFLNETFKGSSLYTLTTLDYTCPVFEGENPKMRNVVISIPRSYDLISSDELITTQNIGDNSYYTFEGEDRVVIAISNYIKDRVLSGHLYHLKSFNKSYIFDRVLRNTNDYMKKHFGNGDFSKPITYVEVRKDIGNLLINRTIFFDGDSINDFIDFDNLIKMYISAYWNVKAIELEGFFKEGMHSYFRNRVIEEVFSENEYNEYIEKRKEIITEFNQLSKSKGQNLSLFAENFFSKLENFMSREMFDRVMELFLEKYREDDLYLKNFIEHFSSMGWKSGVREFIEEAFSD